MLSVAMLGFLLTSVSFLFLYADCHNALCCYDESRYFEWHYTLVLMHCCGAENYFIESLYTLPANI